MQNTITIHCVVLDCPNGPYLWKAYNKESTAKQQVSRLQTTNYLGRKDARYVSGEITIPAGTYDPSNDAAELGGM